MSLRLHEVVTQVLEDNLAMPPAVVALNRCRQLTKWTMRAKQLVDDEAKFKLAMPGHLRALLQNKRLLVLREMLEELGYPDKDLVNDIAGGFLFNWLAKEDGCFPDVHQETTFFSGDFAETCKRVEQGHRQSACSRR